ncbi:uncharacterized protein LOC131693196 [Topomyia yanbarensis]|uniref:uncharacterized protein LOC131693196 n=1 Tax=Topomyia yanbarensis TaxID=2498891 RepID=UPI00273B232C|nr:uncharacterized protein LOC131693196 [Topomyia yanbarensis]
MEWLFKVTLGLIVIAGLAEGTQAQSTDFEIRCGRFSFAFFANPSDCGRFVFCDEGVPVEHECEPDEIWSQRDASCVLGDRETCELWDARDACLGLDDGHIGFPRNCERYINCFEEQAEIVDCALGWIYVENGTDCVIGSATLCKSLEYLCTDNETQNLFIHPDFCDAFISCDANEIMLDFCPANEIFRSDIQFCAPGDPERCTPTRLDDLCVDRPSGIVAHPQGCTKFVECYENSPTEVQCQRGEVFNPRNAECVVGNDETCEVLGEVCNNQPNEWVIEALNHCDLYIRCSDNSSSLRSCSPGTILRPDMQFCVPGHNETCEFTPLEEMCNELPFGAVFPHPHDCGKYVSCAINSVLEIPCPVNHIVRPGTIECVPGDPATCQLLEGLCIDRNDERIPHPTECGSYIHCHDDQSAILMCPSGEIFEEIGQKCMPGNTVTCEPLICIDQETVVSPHPNLCNLFIQCESEKVFLQQCIQGSIFHPTLLVCTPGNITSCVLDPVEEMCVERFDGTRYPYPYIHECTRYVVCINGQSNVRSCPDEHVLLPQYLECVPGDVDTCEHFEDLCSPDHEEIFPHPSRCDIRIVCIAGKPVLEFCPDGQIVDRESLQCAPGDINDCSTHEFQCDGQPDGDYENPDDCTQFIRCISGEASKLNCPDSEIYRPEVAFCVPGDATNCEYFPLETMCLSCLNDRQYPHPVDCDKFVICQNQEPTVQECERGTVIQPGTTDCIAGNTENCEVLALCRGTRGKSDTLSAIIFLKFHKVPKIVYSVHNPCLGGS